MKTNTNHGEYYTPIQMKIPVDLEKIIEISDPIYTFDEIMEQIDLYKYFAEKGSKTGRPRFDSVPSYSTISNFMNEMMIDSMEDIFNDINSYTFKEEGVDLNHVYIDGTKLEANENKYTGVWKKARKTSWR